MRPTGVGAMTALVVMLCVRVVEATPITLPALGANVDLPAGWEPSSVIDGQADVLSGPAGEVWLGLVENCDKWLDGGVRPDGGSVPFEGLPDGWRGYDDGAASGWRACHAGSLNLAVLSFKGPADAATYGPVLDAIGRLWFSSPLGQLLNVVVLPATKLRISGITDGIRVARTGTQKDTLIMDKQPITRDAANGQVEFGIERAPSCAQASMLIGSHPSDRPAPDGWARHRLGTTMILCRELGGVAIVVTGPEEEELERVFGAGGTMAWSTILRPLVEEQTPLPALADPVELPHSKLRVRVPAGFAIAEAQEPDEHEDLVLTVGGEEFADPSFRVSSDVLPCATQLENLKNRGANPNDAAWVPSGWIGMDHAAYCLTIGDRAFSLYQQDLPRPLLERLMVAIRDDNAPAAEVEEVAETPSDSGRSYRRLDPLLPFPIELALQTSSVDGTRGWGGRAALELTARRHRWSAGIRGELGWDSEAAMSYDAHAHVTVTPGSAFRLIAMLGRDAYGSGDMPAVMSEGYFALGAGFGGPIDRGWIIFDITRHYRLVEEDMRDDPLQPEKEWRFRGELVWGEGRVSGVTADYRSVGLAHVFLLGLLVQL